VIFPAGVDKKASGIYSITCLNNGKCYVGSAVSLRGRFATHLSYLKKGIHHGVRLQNAWTKHGAGRFLYEILELVPDKADLIHREQMHIDLLGAAGIWGYNTAPRAGSMLGFKFSEASRAKMSAKRKVLGISEATQAAARLAWPGRKHTEATLEKQRLAKQGKPVCQSAHDAALAANTGHHRRHSPETRAKISAAHMGKAIPETTKAALIKATKGVKWTPERIAKRTATLQANRAAALAQQLKAA
jgi:group I intron endonuclease